MFVFNALLTITNKIIDTRYFARRPPIFYKVTTFKIKLNDILHLFIPLFFKKTKPLLP